MCLSFPAVTLGFPPTSTPVSATSNIVFSAPQSSAGLLPSYEKPVGSTARGSGIDFKDLPPRFRRKLIDQQEIEYIEVCVMLVFIETYFGT